MNAVAQFPVISRARAFDPAIAAAVCEAIAEGATLDAACQKQSVSASSVLRWAKEVDTFAELYAQAKHLKLARMAEGLAPLAREARTAASAHEVQAIKLEVDTHKWLLSKLEPHTYGDKLDVTSKGEALAAPSHQVDARVQSIVMQAAMRMQAGQADSLDDEAKSLLE